VTELTGAHADYKDRRLILIVIGALSLLIGAGSAFLGPLEMYCFYLFSEGGRFHYEGFGFGSFMFGNIACQIVGYYLIGVLFVALGYGHLTMRRWARTLALTALGFWLVSGVPLSAGLLFILFASKDLSPVSALLAITIVGLSYLVLPGVLIRFYRSRDVRLTFESRDPSPCWIERIPLPVLTLCSLFLLYIVILHVPILFNGVFPLFGVLLSGMPGIFLSDVLIMCLACLVWGMLRLRTWAWWGSLAYFGALTSSLVVTLPGFSLLDIFSQMRFPPREMEFLQGLPFHGFHVALTLGLPLVITLGLIIFSKRYFKGERLGSSL
jgi:hypothetical protein